MRFNQRVLEEAEDASNPLLERVKFLAITASNLDEFVEIRVAGMLQRIEDGYNQPQPPDEGGLTPQQRLDRLSVVIARVRGRAVRVLERTAAAGAARGEDPRAEVARAERCGARAVRWTFYENEVDPLLTPVTIDPSHPFPRVLNKALCIGLLLRHKRRRNGDQAPATALGVVTVPRALPRLVPLPGDRRTLRLHPAA